MNTFIHACARLGFLALAPSAPERNDRHVRTTEASVNWFLFPTLVAAFAMIFLWWILVGENLP
jgi:hypothetical protein